MKTKQIIDINLRKSYIKKEKKKIILKKITISFKISNKLLWNVFIKQTKLNRRGSISNVQNRCIFTSNSRFIFKFSHLSRLALKKLISFGNLNTYQKISW